jgi:hypothetical protein
MEIVSELTVVEGLLMPLILEAFAFSNTKGTIWIRNAPTKGSHEFTVERDVLGLPLVISG